MNQHAIGLAPYGPWLDATTGPQAGDDSCT